MFTTPDVKVYLKSIQLDVKDDKRVARIRFFVPATYNLCMEASPVIADTLYKERGSSYDPILEIPQVGFNLNIPRQSLSYRRSPDYVGHQVLVPDVATVNVIAQRIDNGAPDFTLMYSNEFEIQDKDVITDLVSLLHENFFVTYAPMQAALFPKDDPYKDLLCRLCEAPNPEWIVENSNPLLAYCEAHKEQTVEGERLRRIRDTAQASAVVDQMQETKGAQTDGSFINDRASRRRRSRAS
jgi:hypothetical protein